MIKLPDELETPEEAGFNGFSGVQIELILEDKGVIHTRGLTYKTVAQGLFIGQGWVVSIGQKPKASIGDFGTIVLYKANENRDVAKLRIADVTIVDVRPDETPDENKSYFYSYIGKASKWKWISNYEVI